MNERQPDRAPTAVRVLPRSFYDRPVLEVARDLLGMRLVRSLPKGRRLAGRIVEVEAYDGPGDAACHASRGLTARTAPMFGDPGHAYIYFVYGMHHCLNVVTGPEGYPAAVLIRAVEPAEGTPWMDPGRVGHVNGRRNTAGKVLRGVDVPAPLRIASGPGRLTRAFWIGLGLNRADLCASGPLVLEAGEPVPSRRIVRGPRIGVAYAGAWALKPWRFAVRDHPCLSRPI